MISSCVGQKIFPPSLFSPETRTVNGITRVEHKHYVYGAEGAVTVVTRTGGAPVWTTRYLHTDHRGSLEVITDAAEKNRDRFI